MFKNKQWGGGMFGVNQFPWDQNDFHKSHLNHVQRLASEQLARHVSAFDAFFQHVDHSLALNDSFSYGFISPVHQSLVLHFCVRSGHHGQFVQTVISKSNWVRFIIVSVVDCIVIHFFLCVCVCTPVYFLCTLMANEE